MLACKIVNGPKEVGNYYVITVLASDTDKNHTWVEDLYFIQFDHAYQFETEVINSMEPVKIDDWRNELQ